MFGGGGGGGRSSKSVCPSEPVSVFCSFPEPSPPDESGELLEKQEKSMKMVIPVFDQSKAMMVHLREAGYSNLLNCQHFQ